MAATRQRLVDWRLEKTGEIVRDLKTGYKEQYCRNGTKDGYLRLVQKFNFPDSREDDSRGNNL
jgi:hypothetical protein